jgi:gluconolactonase
MPHSNGPFDFSVTHVSVRVEIMPKHQLLLAVIAPLTVAGVALGQLVPRVAGDFEKLWTVKSGRSWLEGPAYDGAGGIWFTNLKDLSPATPTDILRHDIASGTTAVMVQNSGGANGLAFDSQGRLLAALWHQGSLTRRPVNELHHVEVLADDWQGTPLVAPNDLTVAADGGIYFSDSGGRGVYYLNSNGDLSLGTVQTGTNGIALSPTGDTLYVVAGPIDSILSFRVSADGALTDRRVFAQPRRFLDGLTVDRLGNLYAPTAISLSAGVPLPDWLSTGHEVRVWNSSGEQILAFEPPELAVNAAFAPGDMLYLTTLTSLYRVPITFLHPGDYNGDEVVDRADYQFWTSHFGATSGMGLRADGNGNGIVDAADYVVWRENLGADSVPEFAVPEPPSYVFAAAVLFTANFLRVKSCRQHLTTTRNKRRHSENRLLGFFNIRERRQRRRSSLLSPSPSLPQSTLAPERIDLDSSSVRRSSLKLMMRM